MKLDPASVAPSSPAPSGGARGAERAGAEAAGQGAPGAFARLVEDGPAPGGAGKGVADPQQEEQEAPEKAPAEEAAPWLALLLAEVGAPPGQGEGARRDGAGQDGGKAREGAPGGALSPDKGAKLSGDALADAKLAAARGGMARGRGAERRRDALMPGEAEGNMAAEALAAKQDVAKPDVAALAAAAGRRGGAKAPGAGAPLPPDGPRALRGEGGGAEELAEDAALDPAGAAGRGRRRRMLSAEGLRPVEGGEALRLEAGALRQERFLGVAAASGGTGGAAPGAAAGEGLPGAVSRAMEELARQLGLEPGLAGRGVAHRPGNAAGGAKVLRELEIRLHPASLGTITARLSSEEGEMRIVLVAPSRDVAEEMEKGLETLAGRIRAHHDGPGRISIQVQTEAQGAGREPPSGGAPGGDLAGDAAQGGAAAREQGGGRGRDGGQAGGSSDDHGEGVAPGRASSGRGGVLYL